MELPGYLSIDGTGSDLRLLKMYEAYLFFSAFFVFLWFPLIFEPFCFLLPCGPWFCFHHNIIV